MVQTEAVNDDVPTESEVNLVVRGMKGERAGSTSGMRTEDLKGWHKEAKCEKYPEGRRWELVVRFLQVMFRDGTVP